MYPTDARVAGLSVRLAPLARGIVPLRRAPIVRQAGARRHHVAIDAARGSGTELASGCRRHDFVHQRHPLDHFPPGDEDPAAILKRQGLKVAVAQPEPDGCRFVRERQRPLEIAVDLEGEHRASSGKPSMLRRFGECRQMPFRATQPSVTHRHREPVVVIFGQGERHRRGAAHVAALHVAGVGPLPRLDAVVGPSHPPRRLSQPHQVVGLELSGRIGRHELLERGGPVVPRECPPACRPCVHEARGSRARDRLAHRRSRPEHDRRRRSLREQLFQARSDLQGRLPAVRRILMETPHDQLGQDRGHLRLVATEGDGFAGRMGGDDLADRETGERRLTSQQLVSQCAEPVNVGSMIHACVGRGLLRCHVGRSADRETGLGCVGARGFADHLRDPEVGDQRVVIRQQHVAGLDVPMDHPLRVGIGQRVGDVPENANGFGERKPVAPREPGTQRMPCHIGHGVPEDPGVLARIEDRKDVRVLQAGREPDLAEKAVRAQ